MVRLLADHNIELHADLIWSMFTEAEWADFGVEGLARMSQAGLPFASNDRSVWVHCQSNEMLLITANRNESGVDSLGIVIAELRKPRSLPVLTIANASRILARDYREDCAYRIADIALRLDELRGTGRLFIP